MGLLSDPALEVIGAYGLEHRHALEFSTLSFSIFGLPLALVPTVRRMAIPTTLLIDECGIVRWIDQTDDYRLRSSPSIVLGAVERFFSSNGIDRSRPKGPLSEV